MSFLLDLELFGKNNIDFLSNKMSLDLEDIENKIKSQESKEKKYFRTLFDFMTHENQKYVKKYKEVDIMVSHKIGDMINSDWDNINKTFKIDENNLLFRISDAFRHCYNAFCMGGILGAYERREAEGWYPRIIIKEHIESDICELDKVLTIYRGTSRAEYDSGIYQQSWSLDEKIADDFAFKHYHGQDNYKDTMRVSLKAKIYKEFVYYYDKENIEKEVIINGNKLKEVKIIKQEVML